MFKLDTCQLSKCYYSPVQVHSKPGCLSITEGNLTKDEIYSSFNVPRSPVIYVKIGSPTSFSLCLPVNCKPGMVEISRGMIPGGAEEISCHEKAKNLYLLQATLRPVSSVVAPTSLPSPIRHTLIGR